MELKDSYYFTNIYVIATICALSGFLFGFDTGVIAGALIFLKKTFDISLVQQQLIVSSCIFGAFAGALGSGRLADLYGRKVVIIYTAVAFIIGTAIASAANNAYTVMLGRFILGLAIGVSSYTAPLYVSELSPKSIRGRLVTLNILAITGGEVVAHYINYIFIPYESWRLMFLTGMIPAIMLFVFILLLPESPRFYLLKKQFYKAKEIIDNIKLDFNLDELKNYHNKEKQNNNKNYKELFLKKYRGIFFLGALLGIMQQAIGINTIMYYGPLLFEEAGFNSVSMQILATLGLAVVNFIATIFNVFYIDYFGRRVLLITGVSIASVSMFIASLLLKFSYFSTPKLVFIALVLFVIGYAISLGSIFWVIISEIFPLRIRSTAMSIITAIQWLSNFIIASTFLSLINYFGLDNTFMLYAILGGFTVLYGFKHMPETKNVGLETIEKNIENLVPIRSIGKA